MILPFAIGDGWDLPDLEATEPTLGESQVVPFHLVGLEAPRIPLCGGSSATLGYGFMI